MSIFSGIRNALSNTAKKFSNKEYMEAVAAGCALVAYADGEVEAAEVEQMKAHIAVDPSMSAFNPAEVEAVFNRICNQIAVNKLLGRQQALKELREVSTAEQREGVMIALVGIAGSDGEIEPAERTVLREVAQILGVRASDYGV